MHPTHPGNSSSRMQSLQVLQLQRLAAAAAAALALGGAAPAPARALGFKKELKKRKVPAEDYAELPGSDGALRFYDLAPGRGEPVPPGARVTVHFDCYYKGIDVVSSRAARLLGANRTLAEPFEFVAGRTLAGAAAAKAAGDSAGGLFSGQSGPRPPPALSLAVVGMRPGGKRSVLVPPELGYGSRGELEIPPGAPFELQVELLAVAAAAPVPVE